MMVQAGGKSRRKRPRPSLALQIASIASRLLLTTLPPLGLAGFLGHAGSGDRKWGHTPAAMAQELSPAGASGMVRLANPLPAFESFPFSHNNEQTNTEQVSTARTNVEQISTEPIDAGRASSGQTIDAQTIDARTIARQTIDGRTIGTSAAQQWGPAALLRARARTLVHLYRDKSDDARVAAQTLAHFLNLQAAHQADVGAANAMRAYYTRIALVEQLQLTTAALGRVDAEEEKQRALVEQGLPAGSDLSAFARRRIEIADQRLQLEAQDQQLRNLLVQLTKINALCHGIQGEQLDVQPQSLDCARLTQLALGCRNDLRGWRLLAKSINVDSAPEFAKMIPTLVGGWSLPMPSLGSLKLLLCPPDTSGLAANMKRELELTVSQQIDWICQAVDQKCSQLELNYRRIELAEQTIESWRARLEQLQQLQASGGGQPEQFAVAQVELLKAQAAEVSRRLEARLAEVDLSEATGGLAQRCNTGAAWLLTGRERITERQSR